ncbi:MAG: CRISPR system precrRNA processing endoribonuclease RAMP protein Cas6, partial [Coleofasciculus sp.]
MLIRSTWTLTTHETAVLPRAYGLELVKVLHQRMGMELGGERIPSVAFAGLVGYSPPSQGFVSFYPGEFYQLSLSGLQEKAAKAIASLCLESVEFLGARFTVVNRQDERSCYEQLYTSFVANEPEPMRRFELEFTTPTAFAQQRLYLPFPLPALMFRSWLERWNHFAPVYLGRDELIGYLSEFAMVQRHQIKTRSLQLQRGYVNGFVGDVRLQVLKGTDPLLANVASLLVHYGQFAGTGVKTRLGMG